MEALLGQPSVESAVDPRSTWLFRARGSRDYPQLRPGCRDHPPEDAKDAPCANNLRCTTLIDSQLPLIEKIFVDQQGNLLPPTAKG